MAFITLKKFLFETIKKSHLILPFFLFFVFLLPILIIERSHTTLIAFQEGSIKKILRGYMCLYGFDTVFSHDLIDFLFVVSICCYFCNRKKIKDCQVLMPSYRSLCDHKLVECFQLLSIGFHYFEIIVFLKYKPIFYFAVFCSFCVIVTELCYGVVLYLL